MKLFFKSKFFLCLPGTRRQRGHGLPPTRASRRIGRAGYNEDESRHNLLASLK